MSAPPPLRRFVFLLVDGLSMMSLSSAIEPLRSANRLAEQTLYAWQLASLDGESIEASNGIALPAQKIDTLLSAADYVFVCGGLRLDPASEPPYLQALRQAARHATVIGALSTGTWLLARAGLLNGYRCTIHWENLPAFVEEFRDLACSGKRYEIDRDRMTCSGGVAAMDMMLHLIASQHGAELAARVANQFHHERIRDGEESRQFAAWLAARHRGDERACGNAAADRRDRHAGRLVAAPAGTLVCPAPEAAACALLRAAAAGARARNADLFQRAGG
jgi:transcriptional regulator GlxA family with amidase domain